MDFSMLLEPLIKKPQKMLINTAQSWVVRMYPAQKLRLLLIITEEYQLRLELKYENARQFYIKIPESELEGRDLPPIFTNIIRRKRIIECQTIELMKRNQKVCLYISKWRLADLLL